MNTIAQQIHEIAKSKGFYDKERNIGEMLCLIHSEVSEAMEADRKDKYADTYNVAPLNGIMGLPFEGFKSWFEKYHKDTFEDELADIIIRVLDLAAYKGIDIESHVKAKILYNSHRKSMHGKKY